MYNICTDKYESLVTNTPIESVSLLYDLKGKTYELGSMPFKRQFILCWETASFELRKGKEFAEEILTPGMVISVDANVEVTLKQFNSETKIIIIKEAE